VELVVDANILFSFFNKRSRARQILISGEVILHSPEFALKELEGHKPRIIAAFSLGESQFEFIMKLLKSVVEFSPEEEYSSLLDKAEEISPDPDDVDFFALALKHNCAIWSNEGRLKEQSAIEILDTEKVAELFGF